MALPLILTLLGTSAAVFALLWAGSLLVQPYLFNQVADRLGLRAAAGGLILGTFLTGWVYVNTRATSPDRYGTLLEFNPTARRDVTEFDAVRRLPRQGPDGKWAEETVPYKRITGRNEVAFGEGGDSSKPYRPNTSTYMTAAVLVPDAGGDKVRYDAALDARGQAYTGDRVFVEAGGRRYVELDLPGTVYSPSRWAAIGALLLNVAHFGLWFLVLWLVMQYEPGAALGGAAALGLLTMLAVMPLLFGSNLPPAS